MHFPLSPRRETIQSQFWGLIPQHRAQDLWAICISLHQTQRHFLKDGCPILVMGTIPPTQMMMATLKTHYSQWTGQRK